jgi:hypothetical protein
MTNEPKPAPYKGEPDKKSHSFVVSVPRPPVGQAWSNRAPSTIPPRPWVYGNHLMRGAYSVTVAPGASAKSTLVLTESLAMASGRNLLGVDVPEPLKVWYINLEEDRDELERRIHAAIIHHGIDPRELEGRLFISGSECDLIVAGEDRNGVTVYNIVVDDMKRHIQEMGYDAVLVDPFAQSHNVAETNEGYKQVAMEWRKIAQDCNCAVELVHHTRKGNGQELTSQDGRGGGALLNHARDGRVLNKATDERKRELGVDLSVDRGTYFTVTSDKPNYSTGHGARWHRTVGVDIGNGDQVAAVEIYTPPDAFDGISVQDTLMVQRAIDRLDDPRENVQAAAWVGYTVADVLGLDAGKDKARIKRMLKVWEGNGVLRKERVKDSSKGTDHPVLVVGEWVNET